MYLIAVLPPILALVSATGLLPGGDAFVLPAVLSWLAQIVVLMMMSSRSRVFPVYGLTAPLGLGLLYAMLLDSSIRITIGKGVMWKGRRIYERAGVSPPRLSLR
jgi:hypothetical protein